MSLRERGRQCIFCLCYRYMSKTDRQTDKSTWWIATAWNDGILKLEDVNTYPKYVTKVYGGREECPSTGKEHFQGAIQCVSQVRMSALLKWLPGAECHWEAARSAEAIRKYCMKSETATGEKTIRDQPNKYYAMHDILIKMAVERYKAIEDGTFKDESDDWIEKKNPDDSEYWFLAKRILRQEPHLITSFSDSRYKTAWIMAKEVWCEQALSITEPVEKISDSSINADSKDCS